MDTMTYLWGLSRNDLTAGVTTARQVHDREALSTKPAARLTESVASANLDIWTLITVIYLNGHPLCTA